MTTLSLEPGQILNNRYRLERLIGKGGMGQVFLSTDLSLGSQVALKTFHHALDDADRRRFEREIRTLQTLDHPHIVPFRDLGWAGAALFFTMDYQPGVTLEDVLGARGAMASGPELAWHLRVLLQILEALAYLHKRRIVHRDVKPSNILLRTTGDIALPPAAERWTELESVAACLTDFGLVKTGDGDGALTRTTMGTPQYMSPEQIEASPAVDERSDLYSLGVILYRALTGRLPFERLSDALARRPAPSPREQNPEVPDLLDGLVRRLLEFEPFRRPASAWEVVELLRAVVDRRADSAPAVAVAAKMTQPAFSGRSTELRLLKDAVREAARGKGRWISITGERGTGKSWLVTRSDFKSHALVEEHLPTYTGSFGPKRPHAGFQEVLLAMLRHIERHQGSAAVVEVLGRWGHSLRTLIPELEETGWLDGRPVEEPAVPAEILNERIFETVVGVLTAHAEVEPRVIVLEDLHNLDDFDLELLHRLVINCLPLPVLLVTTHRAEGGDRQRALERLLNEARSEDRLVQLELPPLAAPELRAMVSSLLTPASEIPDDFVAVLRERTDGVPLYVLHMVNSLWNRGMIRLNGGRWEVDPKAVRDLPIPESTRSHFLLLLDELPARELRVLNLAAILGPRFSFDVLQRVLEMDEFELDDVCRNLVHAGLLVEHQDGFRFQHSFEQEIIVSRLSRPMFRRLHARVGKVLEVCWAADLERHLGEIAEHMVLGGDQAKGLDYLCRAARKAEAAYALRTALAYYLKALELTQDPVPRRGILGTISELHIRLGEPELALGHLREAVRHFNSVEEALLEGSVLAPEQRQDLEDYARLLLKFGEVYLRQADFAPALENFQKSERIARLLDNPEAIAFSLVRQGGAHYSLEDPARAEEAYQAAIRLYQTLPPANGLANAFNGLGVVEKMRGNFERALEHTTRGLEIAQKIGDSIQTALLLNNFGILYRSLGRLREAVQSFERSIEILERLGDPHGTARAFMNLGRAQLALGDLRRGLEALTRARDLFHAIGDKKGMVLTLGNLGMVQFYFGDFTTARTLFSQYLADARRVGIVRCEADALNSLGLVELETDNYAAAEEHFGQSLECFRRAGDTEGILINRLHIARVRGRQGRVEEALELRKEVRRQADEMDYPESIAHALRIEAEALRLRGECEPARELAEKALASFEDQGLPYQQGVCCRTLGKIYRDLGFYWADQASKHFERALRIFEMLGARHALAVTQVEFAVLLGHLEEGERARDLIGRARPVFQEAGSALQLERVNRELKAVGS